MELPFLSDEDFFENCPPQTLCSVCGSNEIRPFMLVGDKYYWTCNVCKARILSCKHWLSKDEEFKYYQTHENISSDPAYQKFAAQLALPILDKLVPNSSGLDFGCGPDSALSEILRQHGHNMTVYDPFFFPDKNSLKKIFKDKVEPNKKFKKPSSNEKKALENLVTKLSGIKKNLKPEEIQTIVYATGKENSYEKKLRDWFKLIYEVVFGEENGPRMGYFVSFF